MKTDRGMGVRKLDVGACVIAIIIIITNISEDPYLRDQPLARTHIIKHSSNHNTYLTT